MLTDFQMALDLDAPQRPARMQSLRAHGQVVYHPESSRIEASRFELKFSYRGRSFLVRGAYHLTGGSQVRDESLERSVDCVVVDRILTFRNGTYAYVPVLRLEESALANAAREVLKDPYSNAFLTLAHSRGVAA